MQIIGFEDAELWRILMKKDKKKPMTLLSKCFKAFNDYQTSIELYRETK
jgi:hypothetical protein